MDVLERIKKVYHEVRLLCNLPFRNKYCLDKKKAKKNRINLEWVNNNNLGDALGPLIYNWMITNKGINENTPAKKNTHLYTCGSLVAVGDFDAVIWGSGAHVFRNAEKLLFMKGVLNYDVRAVRGPLTRQLLLETGHNCPEVYGDPAVIMPLIYYPVCSEKKYELSIVLHYYNRKEDFDFNKINCHIIDIGTTDYKKFIDEIKASKKVISSSLHGIILAETYGVPAVFLNTGGYIDKALLKYYDWYYSTNRWSVKMARSIEEAAEMEPMPLPDLNEMRAKLVEAFPYDLWKDQKGSL